MRPVVKWVGGKRQLVRDICRFVPEGFTNYVEPFVGGAALLFHLRPSKATINDVNTELIGLYEVIRDTPEELIDALERHDAKNSEEYFYKVRKLDRTSEWDDQSKVERAARLIYLNKTCYNGLYRVNSRGEFNSPYGRYKKPKIVDADNIQEISSYFRNSVDIRSGDYAECLQDLPRGSFVYLDPPYMPISATSSFTSYTPDKFGLDQQIRLRDQCIALREKGIYFLESNSDCPEIRELYADFEIETVKASRFINSNASRRGKLNEVLIHG